MLVITDSGGMQEETTFLDVPCLNSARKHRAPSDHHDGNKSVSRTGSSEATKCRGGNSQPEIGGGTRKYETNRERQPCRIPLGDGHAAERIAEIISATRKFDEELSNVRAPQRPVQAEFGLELRAGVGVDFAVQANFFKSGCSPLHDFSPMSFRASLPRNVP